MLARFHFGNQIKSNQIKSATQHPRLPVRCAGVRELSGLMRLLPVVIGMGARHVCVKSQRLCAVAETVRSVDACDDFSTGLRTSVLDGSFLPRLLDEVRRSIPSCPPPQKNAITTAPPYLLQGR